MGNKYLVSISFVSCELSDTTSYAAVLKSLQDAAMAAILWVEAAR